jgi:hypothetical protein
MEVEKLQMLFHAMKGDIDSPKAQCTRIGLLAGDLFLDESGLSMTH